MTCKGHIHFCCSLSNRLSEVSNDITFMISPGYQRLLKRCVCVCVCVCIIIMIGQHDSDAQCWLEWHFLLSGFASI